MQINSMRVLISGFAYCRFFRGRLQGLEKISECERPAGNKEAELQKLFLQKGCHRQAGYQMQKGLLEAEMGTKTSLRKGLTLYRY